MMKLNHLLLAGGMAVLLCASANEVMAQNNNGGGGGGGGGRRQGRGNFDPAQFQQQMMDRYKETLEITDDTEWKAIQPLIQKVMDARMASFGGRGGFGRGPRPGGNAGPANQGGPRGASNPEAEALQKAIDAKASGAELKPVLAKYLESRKTKQADLEKAQADLRKVLTPRQEAIACMNGLL